MESRFATPTVPPGFFDMAETLTFVTRATARKNKCIILALISVASFHGGQQARRSHNSSEMLLLLPLILLRRC